MQIIFKQIYLIYRWNQNNHYHSSVPGSNYNKGVNTVAGANKNVDAATYFLLFVRVNWQLEDNKENKVVVTV